MEGSSNIRAELLLATRPADFIARGLVTFIVDVPKFIWTEILTHKRLARNASSSRAQSVKRHTENGYYAFPVFHEVGDTYMQGGREMEEINENLQRMWRSAHENLETAVEGMQTYAREAGYKGIAKQEINRLFPTTLFVKGMLTATEDGWKEFLVLRTAKNADPVMRELAFSIKRQIADIDEWSISGEHIPFDAQDTSSFVSPFFDRAVCAAARIARISNGAPGPGQKPDHQMGLDLLIDKHMSPFEHIARWSSDPNPSALCSKPADFDYFSGWSNFRSEQE